LHLWLVAKANAGWDVPPSCALLQPTSILADSVTALIGHCLCLSVVRCFEFYSCLQSILPSTYQRENSGFGSVTVLGPGVCLCVSLASRQYHTLSPISGCESQTQMAANL
jgi:hypothetical protein